MRTTSGSKTISYVLSIMLVISAITGIPIINGVNDVHASEGDTVNAKAPNAYRFFSSSKQTFTTYYMANGTDITVSNQDVVHERTEALTSGVAISYKDADGQTKTDLIESGKGKDTLILFGGIHGHSGALAKTNITVESGYINTIYAGGMHNSNVATTNLTINGGEVYMALGGGSPLQSGATFKNKAGCDAAGCVFPGSQSESKVFVGKSNVTVNGGKVDYAFGGGDSYQTTGESSMTVNGGTMLEVIGGGSNGHTENASIKFNGGSADIVSSVNRGTMEDTSIEVNGGTITDLYVMGNSADPSVSGTIGSAANVNVNDGNVGSLNVGKNGGTVISDEANLPTDFTLGVGCVDGKVNNINIDDTKFPSAQIEPAKTLVTEVTLSKTTMMMNVGGSKTLVATATPAAAENKNIEWKTDDSQVASVDSNGLVKAGNVAGETTIHAISKDNSNAFATCKVTVQNDTVAQAKTPKAYKFYSSKNQVYTTYFMANGTDISISGIDMEHAKTKNTVSGVAISYKDSEGEVKTISVESGKGKDTLILFGGSHGHTGVMAESNITVESGYINTIYAGGMHNSNVATTNLTINGGEVTFAMGGGSPLQSASVIKNALGCEESACVFPADQDSSKVFVGKSNVTVNGGKVDYAYGGGDSYQNTADASVTINDGNLLMVIGGGSNGHTSNADVAFNGGTAGSVFSVNRGTMNNAALEVNGGSIENLYMLSPEDANATGTIASGASVNVTGGDVTNCKIGQNGGVPITSEAGLPTGFDLTFAATEGVITNLDTNMKAENFPSASFETNVSTVTLSATTLNMICGDQATLTASVKPDTATNKDVTWSSSDESVATVDNNGKITAKQKPGTAVITATSDSDSRIKAECVVNVKARDVASLNLSETNLKLNTGDTKTLTATILPDNSTFKDVIWTSSNADIATVDEKGLVTATQKEGTAIITATAKSNSNITASCEVTVVKPVSIIRTPMTKIYLKKGTSFKPAVVIYDGNKVISAKLDYTTSNKKIAKVSSSGKITAKKPGKATIRVIANNGETRKITVVVAKKTTKLKKIKITGVKNLKKGKIGQIKIKTTPSKATNLKVTFKSSKKSVATVDKAGRITAKAKGKTKITVKVGKKTYKKTIKVK